MPSLSRVRPFARVGFEFGIGVESDPHAAWRDRAGKAEGRGARTDSA
jgi:hypothetical protein